MLGLPENCKKFWSYINSTLNSVAPTCFRSKGSCFDKPETIAQAFSDTFQENFAQVSFSPDICPRLAPADVPILGDITCDEAIVEKLLSDIKSDASPGPDGIPAKILNKCSASLSRSLAAFFNYSLKSGQVPSLWKEARVIPVYKSGDRADMQNYRPISITSLICKILEKIVVHNLLEHFRNNNLININQHGFLPKRSCVTMLAQVLDDWAFNVAKSVGKQVDVISLDWSKAFDKVPHVKIISKLWSYKIRGSNLNWLRSFLSDRTQKVVYRGACSKTTGVPSGVCQGSVIGPLLFIIFMMDLPKALKSSSAQYADDSSVYHTVDNNDDTVELQNDLNTVNVWSSNNDMSLNAAKSSHLLISTSQNPIPSQYHINDEPIPKYNNIKCLGLNITDDMKWNLQTDCVSAKAFRILGMIRRSLNGSRRCALRSAYLSLVRPILLYATPAWNPVTEENLNKLERVQNVATSLILGKDSFEYINGVKHRLNSSRRNHLCKLPSIREVLKQNDLVFLHKCIMGETDFEVFHPNRISVRSKPSMLRGGGEQQLVVPNIKAAYYNNTFVPRSVASYNKLSLVTRSLSVPQFKTAIR
jgi:Reverse transcriptase (RNA-dependent DNA polymerase)